MSARRAFRGEEKKIKDCFDNNLILLTRNFPLNSLPAVKKGIDRYAADSNNTTSTTHPSSHAPPLSRHLSFGGRASRVKQRGPLMFHFIDRYRECRQQTDVPSVE